MALGSRAPGGGATPVVPIGAGAEATCDRTDDQGAVIGGGLLQPGLQITGGNLQHLDRLEHAWGEGQLLLAALAQPLGECRMVHGDRIDASGCGVEKQGPGQEAMDPSPGARRGSGARLSGSEAFRASGCLPGWSSAEIPSPGAGP